VKESYDDIKRRIDEEPSWYDANGVPRYDPFHPNMCPDAYAEEVLLLEIACQNCEKRFLGQVSWKTFGYHPSYAEEISGWQRGEGEWWPVSYGDPPRHSNGNCVAGDVMSSDTLRVVEFWCRGKDFGWERIPEYEVRFEG